MNSFPLLTAQITRSDYQHVLLNPLPVYGLLFGILALVIALAWRSRTAQLTALGLILLGAVSAWPAYATGQQAYHTVYLEADGDGKAWLDAHKHRGERLIYVYAALAAVAAVAMLLPLKIPQTASALALLTLVLAWAALGIGAWAAFAGGRVRHEEFRKAPPPRVNVHQPGRFIRLSF